MPLSYNGRGPAESCANIVGAFSASGLDTTVYLPRARKPFPPSVKVAAGAMPGLRMLPWGWISELSARGLNGAFLRALDQADPDRTILYFWPDPPVALVEAAKARGFIVVREMINCACATSGEILDRAYARHDLPPNHAVTESKIATETAELALYDYIFVSNAEVEKSLRALGIDDSRILPTSFGWREERFAGAAAWRRPESRLRVVFVGSIGVRKGVPELLAAWKMAGIDGELCLAGGIESDCEAIVRPYFDDPTISYLGYVEDIGGLYRSSDIFVFPTLEEGGPQVTYEAAGCGLPSIVTPMGAARIIVDGETGLVVPPGDPAALAEALKRLAGDAALRARMGEAAAKAAGQFEYDRVGRQRADYLASILDAREDHRVFAWQSQFA